MAWFGMNVSYTPQTEYIGVDTIQFVLQDRWGTFSDVVTLKMVVMESKCQNGGLCTSKKTANIALNKFVLFNLSPPIFFVLKMLFTSAANTQVHFRL